MANKQAETAPESLSASLAKRQVLLIKTSSLGDVIHAMPAITEAASHNIEITWVVEEAFAQAASLHPDVRKVIPVAWRRWRKSLRASKPEIQAFRQAVQEQSYDLVLDSQGLIKSALISLFGRGPRAGYAHTSAREPWAAFAYQHRHQVPKGQHAVLRQRQLFAQALGYELAASTPDGLPPAQERKCHVVLLHGTTWQTKHYPEHMWIALGRMIQNAGYEVVLTWGNDAEEERAQRIAQVLNIEALPKQELAALAQTLAQASAVIGVDTGLTHLSAIMGTPTVGLYGPTATALTGPAGRHCVSLESQLPCAPCIESSCKRYSGDVLQWAGQPVEPACFASVLPDEVWRTTQALMQSDVEAVQVGV